MVKDRIYFKFPNLPEYSICIYYEKDEIHSDPSYIDVWANDKIDILRLFNVKPKTLDEAKIIVCRFIMTKMLEAINKLRDEISAADKRIRLINGTIRTIDQAVVSKDRVDWVDKYITKP
jgi:hypothetical protein